jgi:hypothetical protein
LSSHNLNNPNNTNNTDNTNNPNASKVTAINNKGVQTQFNYAQVGFVVAEAVNSASNIECVNKLFDLIKNYPDFKLVDSAGLRQVRRNLGAFARGDDHVRRRNRRNYFAKEFKKVMSRTTRLSGSGGPSCCL